MGTETRAAATDGSGLWRRDLAVPAVLLVVTVLSGSLGTYRYLTSLPAYASVPTREVVLESVFASLGFLVLNSGPYPVTGGTTPLLVYVGRGAGVLFFSYAAVLGFGALFAERLKPLRVSAWHLRDRLGLGDAGGHVVVCGVGHKGFELASTLLATGHDVVAIERDGDSTRAAELSDRGAVVLQADATRRRTLGRRARAHLAAEVFVNCGSDRTNTRVVRTLADWLDERLDGAGEDEEYVACHAHIEGRRRRHFVHEPLHDHPHLRLHTYDTASATARELLRRRPVGRFDAGTAGRTHVVLMGWSDLGRALVFECCQTMHYLEDHDRQVTVVCRDPDGAREELYDHHPALDPDHWDREWVRSFTERLFPTVEFLSLPVNEDLLLSDRFDLYDRVRPDDTLTVVVANEDEVRSGSPVATMLPRLEAAERDLDLDTQVHYFTGTDDGHRRDDARFAVDSDVVDIRPFGEFVDDCTPATVRGERRDRVAKRMALFFHLRYDYAPAAGNPTATDRALAPRVPLDPPAERGYDHGTVTALWDDLPAARLGTLAEAVWERLPETDHDANRHAADHAPVKHRLAAALSGDLDREAVVERLAATEHRRWCAAKFLDGWEPLPIERAPEWRADGDAETRFREQKYHLDLRPLDELAALTEGEVEKDVALVRFVLDSVRLEGRP